MFVMVIPTWEIAPNQTLKHFLTSKMALMILKTGSPHGKEAAVVNGMELRATIALELSL